MRDSLVPRRSFIDKIIKIASKNKLIYQLEVEGSGGSDAKELQMSDNPWDWCFIGAGEQHVHSPNEKISTLALFEAAGFYSRVLEELNQE